VGGGGLRGVNVKRGGGCGVGRWLEWMGMGRGGKVMDEGTVGKANAEKSGLPNERFLCVDKMPLYSRTDM